MSKSTELFTIEQLAEALGAEVKAVHDSPTLTRSASLRHPNWRLFAEIEYNHMDRVKVSVSGGHTRFKRYIRPHQAEGGWLECSVGRGRDVTKAAAEVWRKLGVSAEITGQLFREAQTKDESYRETLDQIYDLMVQTMPEAAESRPTSEPRLRWDGARHDSRFELRRRLGKDYTEFDFRPGFDYAEGGVVVMTVPAFTPVISLVEDRGWGVREIEARYRNQGGDVKISLIPGQEVEMVRQLLDCWISYQQAEMA
ncbi:hypothetical protein PU634_10515 [Oceanimonas pelagia]|uniref:Uncharacterized protein n=1 Tax=Oceanimonas pelagia TaxID=3028314 RepID=A0AA50QAX4_9GAMM|nr:hypothetical protein [Oceanimonas pelagia]WMC09549.1 hypothetical protein PU634_10515 [Oceanimonas pelagia]